MRSQDFFTYRGGAHLKSKLTEEKKKKSLRESLIEVGAHLKNPATRGDTQPH